MRVQSRSLAWVAVAALALTNWAAPSAVANHAGEGTPAGTAHALYNPADGNLEVHANGVARVSVFVDGHETRGDGFLPTAADGIGTFLVATVDNPNAGDLTWIALANSIGTVPGFGSVAGNVLESGTPASAISLRYQLVGGAPEGIPGDVFVVPEPGTLLLLSLAGLGLVTYRRRSA